MSAIQAKVAERGQVTIPKKIRIQFGILPGTVLDFQGDHGRIVITKPEEHNPVDAVFGALGTGRSADNIIHSLREPS